MSLQAIAPKPVSRKAESLEVRLDADEKKAFQDAASLSGLSLSAWVRERLRGAAVKDLESAGAPIAFFKHVTLEG